MVEERRDGTSGRPGRVGVVTVSYRSQAVLPDFLASVPLAAQGPVPVVVADNHPDGRVQPIAEAAGARYVALSRNEGYGAAMNAGAAALPQSVEWMLLSNPDVVLGPDSITRLVAAGDEDPRTSSVGPTILTPDGEVYPSARHLPSLRNGIGHALFANAWPDNPWSRAYRRTDLRERAEVGWLSGACLLVRRSDFVGIGGFDTAFFMYFEDVDLGRRLGARGKVNLYEPAAVVTHSGAHSTTADSAAMVAAHHHSARLYLRRRYPSPILAPLRLALETGLRARSLWEARRLATPQPITVTVTDADGGPAAER